MQLQLSEGFNIGCHWIVSVSREKVQMRRNNELREFELSGADCINLFLDSFSNGVEYQLTSAN